MQLLETTRGHSRFSKALPPEAPPFLPAKPPTSSNFPSPPPKSAMRTMIVPRRPVGQAKPIDRLSIASLSSVYSESPGFRSDSSSVTKDSLSGNDSDIDSKQTSPLQLRTDCGQLDKSHKTPGSASSPKVGQLSPQRPEIWRRRSAKGRGVDFSELKLDKSNGSTAQPQHSTIEPPLPLPRNKGQLSTRRKPIPTRFAPPRPHSNSMGKSLSKPKFRSKGKKGSVDESSNDDTITPYKVCNRLPTPGYLKTNPGEPLTVRVLSPEIAPDGESPEIPRKSVSRNTIISSNRANLLSSTSHSRESSATLTITSEPPIMGSPQTNKPYSSLVFTPQPSPKPEITSPFRSPLPGRFPTVPSLAPRGTVFDAPGLKIGHFDCHQQHRFMRNSKTTIYPVACMICGKKDLGFRFECTWCCLRCCDECMKALDSNPKRDLRTLLAHD
ncbi:hypothetical protein B7494_g5791 [Chlorociboria aeruginascens]|nr:hypothetical protein B7494_g5791 [Chlorociboria aeruginascens]